MSSADRYTSSWRKQFDQYVDFVPFSWRNQYYHYTSLLPQPQQRFLQQTQASCTPPRLTVAGALLAAIFFLTITFSGDHKARHSAAPLSNGSTDPVNATKPLFLSLLIPGGKRHNVELCRTVLSAQILNYPLPQVIPLISTSPEKADLKEKDEGAEDQEVAAPPAPKSSAQIWLEANLEWLSRTPPEGEDGIVILLDGPGVYFQLRPQVLLSRYYHVLSAADERATTGKHATSKPIQHSVVFPAQDTCAPSSICDWLPELAPKFLGKGYMIGPVSDIRTILLRSWSKLQVHSSASLHDIFTSLFSEQHLYRQYGEEEWIKLGLHPELGITLDYARELGGLVDPDAGNGKWKNLSSPVPDEISTSIPPFWTVFGDESALPQTASWADVPLYHHTSPADQTVRDSFSSSQPPAMLHHLPFTTSSQRSQIWSSLWLHPYARTLYTAAQHLPSTIVAAIPVLHPTTGEFLGERTFWNRKAKADTAGTLTVRRKEDYKTIFDTPEDFWHWRDMCDGEEEVEGVFGDGKGKWKGRGLFF